MRSHSTDTSQILTREICCCKISFPQTVTISWSERDLDCSSCLCARECHNRDRCQFWNEVFRTLRCRKVFRCQILMPENPNHNDSVHRLSWYIMENHPIIPEDMMPWITQTYRISNKAQVCILLKQQRFPYDSHFRTLTTWKTPWSPFFQFSFSL